MLIFFAELKDVPHGTGTVFARGEDDDNYLYRQPRSINITEREEGIVAQFLQTPAGHLAFCEELAAEYGHSPQDYVLERIFSGLHAGQGRQCFGSSSHQLCDFLLFFCGPPGTPRALFYINYHGMYYHYKGHFAGCSQEDDGPPFSMDPLTEKLDKFRAKLARDFSSLDPTRLVYRYKTISACDLFHSDVDPEDYLQQTIPADCCLPRKQSLWKKKWETSELVKEILAGNVTGFLTLGMGFEDTERGCLLEKNFGFCVQKRKPAEGELSDFTLSQISRREKLGGEEELKKYLAGMPERTFSARSFFGTEETISTTYFCWLVRERGLHNYSISHFMLYKFCDYSKDFLEPILERRHRYKTEKNAVGAECLKLVANGSFGYTALESRNYNTTQLKTDLSLKKMRYSLSSKFSMINASFVGVVRSRSDQKPKGFKRKQRRRRCSFLDQEAAEDDNDDEPEEIDETEDQLGFDHDCMEATDDESDLDNENGDEYGDVNDFLCGENAPLKSNYKFLYTVTVTGKYKRISNCIPRAVSILSNSKKLFLNLVLCLLRASDPAKVEPVYCDTDSIILSCQFPSLEQNLREGGQEYLREMQVVGSDQSETSIHGKLKLEGVFCAGLFRALKVYRLFEENEENNFLDTEDVEELCPSLASLKTVYTRCKGISRSLASKIDTSTFAPSLVGEESLKIHKSSLRPTRAGEMTIQMERKTLAQPYNFKRTVCPDGIHSLPFD